MLVLSRKSGEAVEVDGGIVFRVLKVRGKRVTVGVEAPDGTRVLRAELPRDLEVDTPAEHPRGV